MLYLGGKAPIIHLIGWVGSRAALDMAVEREISVLAGNQTLAVQSIT
jgi:hypothetical protein